MAYAACQEIEILRTDDGGSSWVHATYGIAQTDNSAFISPMVSDPSNGQIVYFGTYRVWQSRDGSGKYAPISPDLGADLGVLSTIAVAPSDPNTIYAGTNNGLAWVTRNAGGSWQKITAGLPVAALADSALASTRWTPPRPTLHFPVSPCIMFGKPTMRAAHGPM